MVRLRSGLRHSTRLDEICLSMGIIFATEIKILLFELKNDKIWFETPGMANLRSLLGCKSAQLCFPACMDCNSDRPWSGGGCRGAAAPLRVEISGNFANFAQVIDGLYPMLRRAKGPHWSAYLFHREFMDRNTSSYEAIVLCSLAKPMVEKAVVIPKHFR